MEFYISPQSGQFYMINVLENQWLSVTHRWHSLHGVRQHSGYLILSIIAQPKSKTICRI